MTRSAALLSLWLLAVLGGCAILGSTTYPVPALDATRVNWWIEFQPGVTTSKQIAERFGDPVGTLKLHSEFEDSYAVRIFEPPVQGTLVPAACLEILVDSSGVVRTVHFIHPLTNKRLDPPAAAEADTKGALAHLRKNHLPKLEISAIVPGQSRKADVERWARPLLDRCDRFHPVMTAQSVNGGESIRMFCDRPCAYIIPPFYLTVRRSESGIYEQGWITGYGGSDVL